MTPTYRNNLISLRDVKTSLDALQVDDPHYEETILLRSIFSEYADELRCRLGIATPYRDDFDRRSRVMYAVRCMDPIFDGIAEETEAFVKLPTLVQGLMNYLSVIATDCAWTISAIEEQHPDHKEDFARERKAYGG
jgi:hypothetical protein